MYLLSGDSNNIRNWSTAFGDNVMGAFLGLNLLFFGLAASLFGIVGRSALAWPAVEANVGLLFCASPSLSLTPEPPSFRSQGAVGGHVECWLEEMLVSGDPLFFGGGISGSSVCGRYADSVIKGRFEDAALGLNDEKGHLCAFKQCAHLLDAAGCAVKRNMLEMAGPAVLRVVILGRCEKTSRDPMQAWYEWQVSNRMFLRTRGEVGCARHCSGALSVDQ